MEKNLIALLIVLAPLTGFAAIGGVASSSNVYAKLEIENKMSTSVYIKNSTEQSSQFQSGDSNADYATCQLLKAGGEAKIEWDTSSADVTKDSDGDDNNFDINVYSTSDCSGTPLSSITDYVKKDSEGDLYVLKSAGASSEDDSTGYPISNNSENDPAISTDKLND